MHGLNEAMGSLTVVPSRYGRDQARKRLDRVAQHTHVTASSYGDEGACLPWNVWLDYWDDSEDLSSLVVEEERHDQVAIIFHAML